MKQNWVFVGLQAGLKLHLGIITSKSHNEQLISQSWFIVSKSFPKNIFDRSIYEPIFQNSRKDMLYTGFKILFSQIC